MTHEHKLRHKMVRGVPMLKCKRCHLLCGITMREETMATKCPGRKSGK